MIVIDMENGRRGDPPDSPATQQPVEYPQPQLQEKARLPPKAVCPPPPLDIDAFLAAFDA
ncbi:MAG: hypothetical protein LBP58_08640 [Azoarcus sp.]|nr:hypothetical protein [Azoarcus sp.]